MGQGVLATGQRLKACQGEVAVEEADPGNVDVEGDVPRPGRQVHPGQGQWVQPAAHVEEGCRPAGDVKDGRIEAVEDGQSLAGGAVQAQEVGAGGPDLGQGTGLIGFFQALDGGLVVKIVLKGAVGLVQPALGGLGGSFHAAPRRQLAGGDAADGVCTHGTVLFRTGHG